VGARDLGAARTPARARTVGGHLARLHTAGLVHGDPTTRNVRIGADDERVHLIDFGLGYHSGHVEDHAIDLHVFARSLAGTTDAADRLVGAAREGYRAAGGEPATLDRLDGVAARGRYR
jgi:N6-L-threonylcarbamoyladenine synthase/protein kinase Bud32